MGRAGLGMRPANGRIGALMHAALMLLQLTASAASGNVELMFNFTQVRQPWANSIQLSEIMMYDAYGGLVHAVNASNPYGTPSPYPLQMPMAAFDLSITTKWVDVGFSANGFSMLTVTPHGTEPIASCASRPMPWHPFSTRMHLGSTEATGLEAGKAARGDRLPCPAPCCPPRVLPCDPSSPDYLFFPTADFACPLSLPPFLTRRRALHWQRYPSA